jgi:hypothetical protein
MRVGRMLLMRATRADRLVSRSSSVHRTVMLARNSCTHLLEHLQIHATPRYALSSQGNDTAYGDYTADVTNDGTLSRTKTTGKTKRKKISFSPFNLEPTSTGSDASDKWIHPQRGTTVAGEHDVRAVSPHTQRSDANLHSGGDVRRLAEVRGCAHCNVFGLLAQF